MKNKAYIQGTEIFATDISKLAESKEFVFVQSKCDTSMYYAFELLSWQLRSLLKVKLFKAIKL